MSTSNSSVPPQDAKPRAQRRTLHGRVTSTRMNNTITVLVERTFKHPKYGKYVRKNKAYHAHDPAEQARDGDLVEIMASRPISKLKRWRLVRVVEAAPERGAEVQAIEAREASEAEGGTQGGAS
jgi:small subunit ribosomal protein S17